MRRTRWMKATMGVACASVMVLSACAKPGVETSSATPQPLPAAESTEATPEPTATPTPAPTPTAGKPGALLAAGATGDGVRDLQARLKQLDWFEGKITGSYGPETQAAVEGFQSKRQLPTSGEVDQATMDALKSMTRTPSADELANKLTPGPALIGQGAGGDKVKDLQARLKQIGWYDGKVTGNYGSETAASVRSFQEKREIPVTGEVDQRTQDRLRAMTTTPTADELNNVEAPKPTGGTQAKGLDPRCMTGRAICISKRSNMLWWVIDGKTQMSMEVRFGTKELPTREGSFNVNSKSRDHVSTIYKTPMPYAMFFSGGQAVHYSPDFAARGYRGGSHGCVNVRDKGAVASLFSQVRVGDKVIVYR